MFIVNIGLNHKTASVEIREKLSFHEHLLPGILTSLRQIYCINGCVILSTCNRTEIYAAVTDIETSINEIKNFLAEYAKLSINEIDNYLYSFTCTNALRHLFHVTTGLDSMILGETQILGQTCRAYQIACEAGVTDRVINTLFQQAITVGKRVHTETKISQNAVSIGYAAVELAKQIFSDLNGKSILIIGAGKISELTARNLLANGISSIVVSNRAFNRAEILAEKFGGKAIRFNEIFEYMQNADIVIVCTAAPHYIIHPSQVEQVMEGLIDKHLCFIDIAVPRNINPLVNNINGVNLYTIDHLKNIVDSNLEQRKKEAVEAEKIIEEEIQNFLKWLNEQAMVPTITALKEKGNDIKNKELNKALNKLQSLTDEQKSIVISLANSIVNQLLHQPIVQLKQFSATSQSHVYNKVLQNLFGLEVQYEDMMDKQIKW